MCFDPDWGGKWNMGGGRSWWLEQISVVGSWQGFTSNRPGCDKATLPKLSNTLSNTLGLNPSLVSPSSASKVSSNTSPSQNKSPFGEGHQYRPMKIRTGCKKPPQEHCMEHQLMLALPDDYSH